MKAKNEDKRQLNKLMIYITYNQAIQLVLLNVEWF